jgi:predicted transcriptional regulator of viral defense system
MIAALRTDVPFGEFDYRVLVDGLADYARLRDRVTRLLRDGAIIRVKKGLYVFGPTYRRGPWSRELIADLISGPSYVSFAYALSFHGLTPEHVETVTSATAGTARTYSTPVGRFLYRPVPARVFWMGVTRMEGAPGRGFLIATREKALADTLMHARRIGTVTRRRIETLLYDNLRCAAEDLASLDTTIIAELARQWPSPGLSALAGVIRGLREARP